MIVPGSGLVKEQAEEEGLDVIFKEAGFDWREPGCSMCLAMNADKLSPGERCASTSNRNFEGRQGRGGRTHLVSPAMAVAAAVTGHPGGPGGPRPFPALPSMPASPAPSDCCPAAIPVSFRTPPFLLLSRNPAAAVMMAHMMAHTFTMRPYRTRARESAGERGRARESAGERTT